MQLSYLGIVNNGMLPNITGYFTLRGNTNTAGGCFERVANTPPAAGTGNAVETSATFVFDANRSSVIYGGDNITSHTWYSGERVIPSSVAMRYVIKY